MTEPACLTCTKQVPGLDQAVSVGNRQEVQTALSKHFWFSESESLYGILCPVCWTKIHDFHQFYTEVESIHAKHPQLPLQLQPDQFLEVKQEEPLQATVFVAEDVVVKSEGDESNEGSKAESDGDDFEGGGDSPMLKEEDSEDDDELNESSQEDDSEYEEEPVRKRGRKPGSGKKKEKKKTGKRRVGRPVQGWQKDIQDESFIAETVNLVCDTCSEKFGTFEDLQQHSTVLHDKLAYIFCCNLKFSRKPRLVDHIQFHLNPSQFACKICSKQFGDREALKRHMRSMHVDEEEKTLQCSVCPKRFAQKRFLNLHEKYHRNLQEKKFHCEPCNRYFAYASLLRHHNEEVHENKPDKYVCHICAKSYNIYTSYKSHVDSHDEEAKKVKQLSMERVQCTDCNAWVYQRGLRKHMLRHSGTQRCDICGQECSSVMTLKYHKAQHRKDDLTCSVCEKVFKRMINFKEHMASHTGDVLYSCDFCDKTFNSNANRASHRKKMHPKEWLEDKMRKNPNLMQEQFQQQQPA